MESSFAQPKARRRVISLRHCALNSISHEQSQPSLLFSNVLPYLCFEGANG